MDETLKTAHTALLAQILGQLDYALVRWARKYKRLEGSQRKARAWVKSLAQHQTRLLLPRQITFQPVAGR